MKCLRPWNSFSDPIYSFRNSFFVNIKEFGYFAVAKTKYIELQSLFCCFLINWLSKRVNQINFNGKFSDGADSSRPSPLTGS